MIDKVVDFFFYYFVLNGVDCFTFWALVTRWLKEYKITLLLQLELKLGLGGTTYEDFIRSLHLPLQLRCFWIPECLLFQLFITSPKLFWEKQSFIHSHINTALKSWLNCSILWSLNLLIGPWTVASKLLFHLNCVLLNFRMLVIQIILSTTKIVLRKATFWFVAQ